MTYPAAEREEGPQLPPVPEALNFKWTRQLRVRSLQATKEKFRQGLRNVGSGGWAWPRG